MPPRCAVVDLGSNSVRLVVFEGRGRNPQAIFNEKAVLRLGRGLQTTGRLNDDGVAQALDVMRRYHAVARAMHAEPFEVLATAAVRDASNGAEFVAALEAIMPGVPIRVLSGEQEAAFSAAGVLCGIPEADGVLGDIGGGSVELVRLVGGRATRAQTLRLGVIRLSDRAGGDLARARAIVDADLAGVDWLAGRDLYLVGGAWRALARAHMAQSGYPLAIVHHYTIGCHEARALAELAATGPRRILERLAGVPKRRVEDLPFAALVLRRLLQLMPAERVVFTANGLREGWYMQHVAESVRAEDPMVAASRALGEQLGRDGELPRALFGWTAPLFEAEGRDARRLRCCACWLSDIGSHDHPEYRAQQSFLRVLEQPGVALDHRARAFLALAIAGRYDAAPGLALLASARGLLDHADTRVAEALGAALRLAYVLSAGTPDLLARTALRVEGARLVLTLAGGGVFAGESVTRRLDALAGALGLAAMTEVAG
jgi:exopolyphosphatase/guanosine-5'-triphosphate,3'-diphosphate pyrophosphatase